MKRLQAPRGMNDICPPESELWQGVLDTMTSILHDYAYRPIHFPLVESTDLFKRTVGEATDIVEKEMYTFADLNGDSLTLRPEGTAGCVRAGVERGFLHNQTARLFYFGPMFRHERPQKGRYRQFYQLGVEAFGFAQPTVEIELIAMTNQFWRDLGLKDVRLELNTLGTPDERKAYRKVLVEYFEANRSKLDEDSIRRLDKNPMRILDSKNPDLKELIANAPKCIDSLGAESKEHFATICHGLEALGIPYTLNQSLVRGLDYYTHTVFEWVTDSLGAQGTICAGGRYDGLVEQLGGKATPGVGFALGMERLVEVLGAEGALDEPSSTDVFVINASEDAIAGVQTSDVLRSELIGYRVQTDIGTSNIKKAFKRADKEAAKWVVIVGDDELKASTLTAKLMQTGEQRTAAREEIIQWIKDGL